MRKKPSSSIDISTISSTIVTHFADTACLFYFKLFLSALSYFILIDYVDFRNFVNKLWNAGKYLQNVLANVSEEEKNDLANRG